MLRLLFRSAVSILVHIYIVNNSPELTQRLLGISIKPDLESKKLLVNPLATSSTNSSINYSNSLLQQQLQNDSLNNNNTNEVSITTANNLRTQYLIQMSNAGASSINSSSPDFAGNDPTSPTSSNSARPPQRRRVRRKATSSLDDQAEHLTEMSVRGLDLFRYASITEGIYQCTECAKENVQKTFKNKYSFQRHAFLYHEGKHRKVFPCPVCGKEFSRPDKMKNHMKTTHECFIPKEINYHHPLNYLITAATAGDIPQLFSHIENSSPSAGENPGIGYESSSISPRVSIVENTTPNTNQSSSGGENPESQDDHEIRDNVAFVKDEILDQPLLPISIAEPSISIMDTEEVK
ncbi:unnamed protein product [Hermetia illucens]|uniref:C2H2-type domain-containing protein n=1 Tax=Hermetia illucens TaxID=343691 RepID=A0A7R8Z0K7_HERIL|nr:unnamed protein product [Hermetia illucens]